MQQTKDRATTVEEDTGLLKQIQYADTARLGYITTHCCDFYWPTQGLRQTPTHHVQCLPQDLALCWRTEGNATASCRSSLWTCAWILCSCSHSVKVKTAFSTKDSSMWLQVKNTCNISWSSNDVSCTNSMFPKKYCGRAGNTPVVPAMAGKELAASLYFFPGMHAYVCIHFMTH